MRTGYALQNDNEQWLAWRRNRAVAVNNPVFISRKIIRDHRRHVMFARREPVHIKQVQRGDSTVIGELDRGNGQSLFSIMQDFEAFQPAYRWLILQMLASEAILNCLERENLAYIIWNRTPVEIENTDLRDVSTFRESIYLASDMGRVWLQIASGAPYVVYQPGKGFLALDPPSSNMMANSVLGYTTWLQNCIQNGFCR